MRKLKSVILEISDSETIVIDELSIAEYRETLFGLVVEYGDENTTTQLANRMVNVKVAEILNRMQFHYISNWTITDDVGTSIPLKYEQYIQLPYCIEEKIIDIISSFSEV